MYKDLLDSKHCMKSARHQDGKLISFNAFTGEFEPNILCSECDNKILGGFESYANKVLYDGFSLNLEEEPNISPDGVKDILFRNIDYKRFKLFLLSIIWRASISSRDFFENVRLGPHEKNIRKMLIEGDPGKPKDYCCFITSFLNVRPIKPDIILQPFQIRDSNGYQYFFLIAGLMYQYFISRHNIPDYVSNCINNENNELRLILTPNEIAKTALNKMMNCEIFE